MRVTDIQTVIATDVNGEDRPLAVGVEDGMVVGHFPGWWRLHPDDVDRHIAHLELVRDLAHKRKQAGA